MKKLIIPAILVLIILTRVLKSKSTKVKNPLKRMSINSPYGYRFDKKKFKTEFHGGIDLKADENTPIYSPINAKVLKIYTNETGGNQLVIKGKQYIFGFAHLNKVLVKPNQKIIIGKKIALSGNTGSKTTGAHLHLTAKDINGNPINPALLFKI